MIVYSLTQTNADFSDVGCYGIFSTWEKAYSYATKLARESKQSYRRETPWDGEWQVIIYGKYTFHIQAYTLDVVE